MQLWEILRSGSKSELLSSNTPTAQLFNTEHVRHSTRTLCGRTTHVHIIPEIGMWWHWKYLNAIQVPRFRNHKSWRIDHVFTHSR